MCLIGVGGGAPIYQRLQKSGLHGEADSLPRGKLLIHSPYGGLFFEADVHPNVLNSKRRSSQKLRALVEASKLKPHKWPLCKHACLRSRKRATGQASKQKNRTAGKQAGREARKEERRKGKPAGAKKQHYGITSTSRVPKVKAAFQRLPRTNAGPFIGVVVRGGV